MEQNPQGQQHKRCLENRLKKQNKKQTNTKPKNNNNKNNKTIGILQKAEPGKLNNKKEANTR